MRAGGWTYDIGRMLASWAGRGGPNLHPRTDVRRSPWRQDAARRLCSTEGKAMQMPGLTSHSQSRGTGNMYLTAIVEEEGGGFVAPCPELDWPVRARVRNRPPTTFAKLSSSCWLLPIRRSLLTAQGLELNEDAGLVSPAIGSPSLSAQGVNGPGPAGGSSRAGCNRVDRWGQATRLETPRSDFGRMYLVCILRQHSPHDGRERTTRVL
jgi:hypothetical protein